jgi:homoserine dehydrogenase
VPAQFADVLAEAQALGYAEADPSFDIDGIDAAHKLTILAAIAFGIPLQFERIYVEGIRGVTLEDVRYAEALGYRIKHLALAAHTPRGIELRVHPTLIPARTMLANVNGVMNGIMIRGDAVGPMLLSGAGAGAEPTASSVVADLVDVVRALTADPDNRVPHLAFRADALSAAPILPMAEVESAYYIRMRAVDQPGVLADITRILANLRISIEAIRQPEPAAGDADGADHHPDAPRGRSGHERGHCRHRPPAGYCRRHHPHPHGDLRLSARYTGVIERYRARLPIADGVRIISLCEGNTPLIKLENIPARSRARSRFTPSSKA